jgi:hypothetical protein
MTRFLIDLPLTQSALNEFIHFLHIFVHDQVTDWNVQDFLDQLKYSKNIGCHGILNS